MRGRYSATSSRRRACAPLDGEVREDRLSDGSRCCFAYPADGRRTTRREMKQQNEFELRPCEFMGSNLNWSVDVVVASTIEAISPAVDQLMQSLKTSCCPPEQEIAVEMALREALANAIVHGNHEDLHKKVRVCCACDAKRGMLIVVKDQGDGFDPSKIPSPLAGQSILSEHGRGIYLINLLMDEVQFRKGGTEIRMRKDLHPTR